MYEKIPEPSDDENDMLDLAFGLTETSRLGCQVKMTKELDRIKVKLPTQKVRYAGGKTNKDQPRKKKKPRASFKEPDTSQAEQFSLCDAIRYIHAFEVGRPPTSPKYDLAIRLRTLKNGPVVRNRLRLPHAVNSALRICVICPPNTPAAAVAAKAGAALIGEDSVFEAVKEGKIEFDRCICHQDSAQKLNKSGVGRILGPRGLMPSTKYGTIVKDVGATISQIVGASEYRERQGVIRMAVGQLAFTPEQLSENIKAFMGSIKRDLTRLSENVGKDIHEVVSYFPNILIMRTQLLNLGKVLSSTNAPGFSLNGEFRSPTSPPPEDLVMP
ncbi:MAG: hypothetical protein LQ351_004284 [Letrouitia transgressa]|nr:MAG: hypothetical protein LQ351_004284 [Letrouitia transgressa]